VRARLGLLIAAATVVVAGCGGKQSALDPESPAARDITTLWWWMLLAACVVFAGALGMLGIAWVRRRRPGMPLLKGGGREQLWLVITFGLIIPLVTNVALFVVADFVVLGDTEAPAASTTPLTIEVTGRQWFWEVRYPGTPVVAANEIHIPVRTRVNVVALTGDVIHSFWVPQLNRKVDMIPGRRNRVLLEADNPGLYRGQCAEFCGLQHAHMAMWVQAQTPQDFRAWLRHEAAPARAPAPPVFFRDHCDSCHAIRGTAANGHVGPDLTHLGSRRTIAALTMPNTPESLANWLQDPQHAKPGNRMPDLALSKQDISSLVRYLESLK
jgi:cytochrome c oxidase subunit II